MAGNPQRLINRYFAINSAGKVQSAWNVPQPDDDLDLRERCEVTVEDVLSEETTYDCENVFVDDVSVNTWLKRWTLNFPSVRPSHYARYGALFLGSVQSPTGTPANEVQTITRTGTVSGGTFTLSLTLEGRTGVTAPIAWNASTAAITAALTKKSSSIERLIKSGDVTVTGDWTTGIVITFAGRLAKANLPLLVANTSGLTGTTPGLNVAQTIAGDQNYHPIARSTSALKQPFSFALGYKTGSLPVEKFYNAVVERFEPTLNRNGNAGLTVTILSNYEPDEIAFADFTVPVCTTYDPLKTSDCRIEIDGEWKTLDIFSESISLNDNVPVDADTFGFDGADPDALEYGDQPAYSLSALVFGAVTDAADNLALAVKNREKVEYNTHFGMPGDRFSLLMPRVQVKPQSNSRQHAGSRNRSVIALDGVPTRDGLNAPVAAEAYLDLQNAFLQPSS